MSSKEWYLGIDFGTSNTYIVGYEKTENKFYHIFMPDALNKPIFGIPTVITVDRIEKDETAPDDTVYVGKEAMVRPFLKQNRDVKVMSRNRTPGLKIKFDFGNDYSSCIKEANAILKDFFQEIFDKLGLLNSSNNTICNIVIGCPCGNHTIKGGAEPMSEDYTSLLQDCFSDLFSIEREKIQVIPEPALAGYTYLFNNYRSAQNGDVVLVVDSGGGTTDFSVLYWQSCSVEPKSVYVAKKDNSGYYETCDHAGNELERIIKTIIDSQYELKTSLRDCNRIKELLFGTIENKSIRPKTMNELKDSYGVTLPILGKYFKYSDLTDHQNDEKSPFKKYMEEIVTYLKKALQCSRDELGDRKINKILFVGGNSIVTPFREEIYRQAKEDAELREFFAAEIKTVTPFDSEIKINFDGDDVSITCFNAVSIGACMMALGDDAKFLIIPNFEFRREDETEWRKVERPKQYIVKNEGSNQSIFVGNINVAFKLLNKKQYYHELFKGELRINDIITPLEIDWREFSAIQPNQKLKISIYLNQNNNITYSYEIV